MSESVITETTYSSDNTNNNIKRLVKEWYTLDNDIKGLTKRRKEVHAILAPIMKKNGVNAYNLKDEGVGVSCVTRNTPKNIGKKFLLKSVGQYFESQPEMGKEVANFILDAREMTTKDIISGK